MKLGWRQTIRSGVAALTACLICAALAAGQANRGAGQPAPIEKPQMAEEVLKNVQVLRGISMDEFMGTMGFFSSALAMNCIDCHVTEAATDWSKYADDTPLKQTARRMVLMVRAINQANFLGKPGVTCYTCHRSSDTPKIVPSIAEQYEVVPDMDPNDIKNGGRDKAPGGPSVDQILDKYIGAVGGAERLTALTSFIAKGTIEGYDTYHVKVPLEIYAKAPNQRKMVYHTQNGDSTAIFDGQRGWLAAVDRPLPLLALLPGAELDAARLDADLCFPGGIKRALNQWKAGFPVTTINDKEVNVIQGTGAGGSRFKLYFDAKTGLLVRQLRYADTPVGMVPTQVDYSDYREVAGVRMPFQMVVTWTDGQSNILFTDVQPNARIDANQFDRPAPAVLKPRGGAR